VYAERRERYFSDVGESVQNDSLTASQPAVTSRQMSAGRAVDAAVIDF
jgi:hypothetical protein